MTLLSPIFQIKLFVLCHITSIFSLFSVPQVPFGVCIILSILTAVIGLFVCLFYYVIVQNNKKKLNFFSFQLLVSWSTASFFFPPNRGALGSFPGTNSLNVPTANRPERILNN